MAGYWPRSFFNCVFMGGDEFEVHKNAKKKKKRGQYPAILTEQVWSIKDLLYGQKITPKNFAFAGTKRAIKTQLARSGSQSEQRIRFILPSR